MSCATGAYGVRSEGRKYGVATNARTKGFMAFGVIVLLPEAIFH